MTAHVIDPRALRFRAIKSFAVLQQEFVAYIVAKLLSIVVKHTPARLDELSSPHSPYWGQVAS